MTIQIKQESVEDIQITVRDTTGFISDLGDAQPTFEVWSVDDDTDVNVAQIFGGREATVDGIVISCPIWPLYRIDVNGVPGWAFADSAPTLTLPLTVTTGVNDKYIIPSIFFGAQIVNPGTYTSYTAIANAMNAAIGEFNGGYSYYYSFNDINFGSFLWDANVGKFKFDGGFAAQGTEEALNGLTITAGTGRDFLAGTGWTDGQIMFDHAVDPSNFNPPFTSPADEPLAVGRYRLYVTFESLHAQVPRIGPVEFFVY